MYGTQTEVSPALFFCLFENDVKMYGTQTLNNVQYYLNLFENDVKMYGTQTLAFFAVLLRRLRMM